jgi:DNA-binding transcriptional MerR regulator
MQVKEIEQLLNISKDNLRYYESEGLIFPARKANGYRDYSGEDVERLKKVLVLRKLNVPVADIREILNGTKDLNDALDETRRRIDQEIASMNEAKTICEEIEKEHISINELDADRYLERIASEKPSGFNVRKTVTFQNRTGNAVRMAIGSSHFHSVAVKICHNHVGTAPRGINSNNANAATKIQYPVGIIKCSQR